MPSHELPEYPGPELGPTDHDYERYFLVGNLVVGVGFGMQILLYISCVRYLLQKRKTTQSRQSSVLIAYMTLALAIETVFVGVQGNTVLQMYVDNRNFPGGPWSWFLATQYLAINVIFYATFFVLTFLADVVVLWRCWVIWTASGRNVAYIVTAFPTLMIAASFGLGAAWTHFSSHPPDASMYEELPMHLGTAYYSLSIGANVLLTVLIIARLLMYRKQVMDTLPAEHAKHYVSLTTVIVESAALYSVCALLFIATYSRGHPSNQVFLGIASAAQQIAAYLIIYRLASGRAWTKDTLKSRSATDGPATRGHATTLPSMAFGNAPHSSTLTQLGERDGASRDSGSFREPKEEGGVVSAV